MGVISEVRKEEDNEDSASLKEYKQFQELYHKSESEDFDLDSDSADSLEIFRESYQTVERQSQPSQTRAPRQNLFGDGKQFKKFMESEDSFDGYLETATELQHKWFQKFVPTEEDRKFASVESTWATEPDHERLSLRESGRGSSNSVFVETRRNFKNSICGWMR